MRQLNITQKGESINKKVDKKTPKTILDHIECIVELVENSGLSKEFYRKAKKSIDFVAGKMGLTMNQAVLFAIFIEKCDDSRIYVSDFSKLIGCRLVRIIGLMSDIDELEKRYLVRCKRSDSQKSYRVPVDVVNTLKQDIAYTPESTRGLTTKELFKHINRLFNEREDYEISCAALLEELQSLLEDNRSLLFCRQVKEYEKICEDKNDFLLLLLFCHRFANLDDDCVGFHDFEDLYDEKWIFRGMKSNLQKGHSELVRNNILEYFNDNGFGDREYFSISTVAKEKLFAELDIKVQQAEGKKNLILHDSITAKQLFYNKREQSQIEQLAALLHKDHFQSVQEKLEKGGMRKGFACLFHGAPGTGKTETVYQIAYSTGRDIMMVDISETKSMWYGESEKRIKKIFDSYRGYLKTCEIAPILLFNEADAVIGKRKDTGRGSIDQTENAMQNILLQEMENLEGIMIATTNLTQNLDKAFERRFLYKIEFDKPCVEAKEKIWHTMLPVLSGQERLELANDYNFSGGQIENIVRKYTVDSILNGITPTIEAVHSYCRNEFLCKDEERKRVGFTK
ncbi:ATP-binding protein [Dysgonomonas termitidis]|uniref:ATP-binding protein n=1 Tax=Dysgonomonas termitidis TaxID=1516126 RepID=A0ABV9KSH8_9BACT